MFVCVCVCMCVYVCVCVSTIKLIRRRWPLAMPIEFPRRFELPIKGANVSNVSAGIFERLVFGRFVFGRLRISQY